MGTRGFMGFVVDGELKISYNHYDSYPEGLGINVLGWCRANIESLTDETRRGESGGPVDLARRLEVVSDDSRPTPAHIERLRSNADLNVSEQSYNDWYCLLRNCQGDPTATLAAGVIVDASGFPADSLFAEWGYLIDLDDMCLEAYEGFQRHPHKRGRFHSMPIAERGSPLSATYYPVALAAIWSLGSLPSDEEFMAMLTPMDGDE